VEGSLVAEVAVCFLISPFCSAVANIMKARVHKVPERARTSYTESLFPSRTCTRAKSRSSPCQSRSFAKDAKVEVVRRELSLPVPRVEDRVSKSCFVNSVQWSSKSNNHVTNAREQEK
jgi:hypothetical protein